MKIIRDSEEVPNQYLAFSGYGHFDPKTGILYADLKDFDLKVEVNFISGFTIETYDVFIYGTEFDENLSYSYLKSEMAFVNWISVFDRETLVLKPLMILSQEIQNRALEIYSQLIAFINQLYDFNDVSVLENFRFMNEESELEAQMSKLEEFFEQRNVKMLSLLDFANEPNL